MANHASIRTTQLHDRWHDEMSLDMARVARKVTIPNVKQTKDGFQIAVSFPGERYSY
jgi:hypothetical protein